MKNEDTVFVAILKLWRITGIFIIILILQLLQIARPQIWCPPNQNDSELIFREIGGEMAGDVTSLVREFPAFTTKMPCKYLVSSLAIT